MDTIIKKETSKEPEKKVVASPEISISQMQEKREGMENKEKISQEELKTLHDAVDKLDLDEQLKQQAQSQAQGMADAKDEEKIKKLLEIAKKDGVVAAIHVVKKTGDPFLLDMLHDLLVKDGSYKNFVK